MKVALIGGSGFVGTRLLDLLSSYPQEYQCSNIDLLPSYFFNDITVIGDVRNQEKINEQLKGVDLVVLLAAQHRDDVTPISLYYDTNVKGMQVTLNAMEKNNIKRLIFFSSVAIYGLNKPNPNENHKPDPFNHYGKSKWEAEELLQDWYQKHPDWNINIIRPTVIFGERNRGNVYNLLKQIFSGHFIMIGDGENRKSMAYVGNVVSFVKYMMDNIHTGYNVFNYVDKPDLNMNQLISEVSEALGRKLSHLRIPYWLGMMGGFGFDGIAKITGKKLSISSIRVKKFCSTTEYNADKVHSIGFKPPYTLREGLKRTLDFEFINPLPDNITFKSE